MGSPLHCSLSCPLFSCLEVVGCPLSRPLFPYMEVVGSLICMAKFPWAAHGQPTPFPTCSPWAAKWAAPLFSPYGKFYVGHKIRSLKLPIITNRSIHVMNICFTLEFFQKKGNLWLVFKIWILSSLLILLTLDTACSG